MNKLVSIYLCLILISCSSNLKKITPYSNSNLPEGHLNYIVSHTWFKEEPKSIMRLEQYRIQNDATMAVFFFPNKIGSVEQNINRWFNQFQEVKENTLAFREAYNQDGIPVTQIYLKGTYKESSNPFAADATYTTRRDYGMYGVFVEMAYGTWVFKVLGPSSIIDLEKDHIAELVKSFELSH